MGQKIIFLDFDGVISTFEKRWNVDNNKVKLILDIINTVNAKIVVSSSWCVGCQTIDDFKKRLFGDYGKKVSKDNNLMTMIEHMVGVTDHMGYCRGDEINRWINNHENEIESYVIIDDDSDMLDEQLFNFVQTDTYEGITEREVKLCIDILNNKKIINPIRLNNVLKKYWWKKNEGLNSNINELMNDYSLRKFDLKF